MVHKPPESEGTARGRELFMEHKFLSTVVYILHSDLSLVVIIVNTHGSFHCKQGMLLVNIYQEVYTVNKVAYRKHPVYNFWGIYSRIYRIYNFLSVYGI